jgi:hypothetical protein
MERDVDEDIDGNVIIQVAELSKKHDTSSNSIIHSALLLIK